MKEHKIADSWCRAVSNARTFYITGPNSEWIVYRPCCHVWTPGNTVVNKGDLDRIHADIVKHVDEKKSLVCNTCIHREKFPGSKRSVRQMLHASIPADAPWGEFQFLSFQLDIRCNAACVMCGPRFSTLWQQELGKSVTVTEKKAVDTLTNFCKLLDWPVVRVIHFSGGEPLLTDSHEKILAHVPDLSAVELRYQTNGSVAPSDNTLELWRKARQVKLEISLDGTDEQYEYIRYPLKWNQVENTIVGMAEFLEKNCFSAEIHINCTVNPLNLLYLNNLDRWYRTMQSKYPIFKTLNYHACEGPAWGLEAISPKILARFVDTHGADHKAMYLFEKFSFAPFKTPKLKLELATLDLRRKLDWQTTFSKYTGLLYS
jgi:molybdenum cofactor biosynthesis enzyme MoaA